MATLPCESVSCILSEASKLHILWTAQAQANADGVFNTGVESMTVKLTMKRMQGFVAPKKTTKLNMALISRLKLVGKAARDKVRILQF